MTIDWHDITFPAINLWNVPRLSNEEEVMGVDYRPVLAVGIEFEHQQECVDLLSHLLSEDELQQIEDEGARFITEVAYDNDNLPSVECLDAYSGCGWYVGFKLNVRDVERFSESVADAIEKWDQMFPDTPASIIHTVMIY